MNKVLRNAKIYTALQTQNLGFKDLSLITGLLGDNLPGGDNWNLVILDMSVDHVETGAIVATSDDYDHLIELAQKMAMWVSYRHFTKQPLLQWVIRSNGQLEVA